MADMRSTFAKTQRIVNRITASILILQVAAMALMTLVESLRKKHRKLRKFPVTPPEPVAVQQDEITVYTYGEYLFDAMLKAIDSAGKVVYFESYIWKSDATGEAFVSALNRAAERGVEVYAVWDGFGNLVVPLPFYHRLSPRVNVLCYPAFPIPWRPRTWGRNHRKLLCVDGRVGFVGGYNIGSLYATGWRDTHARIVGPGVAELDNAFIDFWNQNLGRHRRPIEDNPARGWRTDLRLHRNTPRIQVYPIRNMYLEAIDRAQERIWLTHAYLLPDEDFVAALRDAANRGVDVRIIIPERSNHVVADWLSRGFYERLLRSGIRLFLYQGAMVHAKTGTIDGHWSTIGTANLDRLSMLGNYELNLEITDRDVATQMESVYATDLSNCIELNEERWRSRSLVAKGTEAFLSPWRPLF
ncbi:cardiolipin synthase [Tessaracoccus bendigoensis DSM 12906]|uniref:Cardiolipin synthase n=2 Tax=Tessaracoccus TaxID=72763 RepID=A0A1M6I9V0_9ACTN|nr:cardiolipin synthase [Tessaracoccus bendigoensis DSM 12906]